MARHKILVLSNLATSIDGKIASRDRGFFPLGTKLDLREMLRLRKTAQAVIIGASTLRPYRKASLAGRMGKQPLNVVVSSSLAGLSPSWPFFKDARIRRILITTSKASAARKKAFAKSCEIVLVNGRNPARGILSALVRRGVKRAIVEGGGTLMWDFVSADLIDEFHLTLTPKILGGRDAPTLVDGVGFPAKRARKLKLRSVRRQGDELYLVYSR
jgi:riboflavin-specific deaminase-like protein